MNINPEEIVDQNLMHDDKGRRVITDVGDSGWGQLILPSKKERKEKTGEGMRMVIFGSYYLGYLLLETLRKFEQQNPSRLNIVGLVSDDPASPSAKISVKRRIWRLYNQQEIISIETDGFVAVATQGNGMCSTDFDPSLSVAKTADNSSTKIRNYPNHCWFKSWSRPAVRGLDLSLVPALYFFNLSGFFQPERLSPLIKFHLTGESSIGGRKSKKDLHRLRSFLI
jgi:hypothetical protein